MSQRCPLNAKKGLERLAGPKRRGHLSLALAGFVYLEARVYKNAQSLQ
jgi:hypothetical protein